MSTMIAKPKLLIMTASTQHLIRPDPDEFEILPFWEEGVRNTLAEKGRGVRAILAAGYEKIGPELLKDLPDLKLIAVIAAGYNGIDVASVRAAGVVLTNAGDNNSGDVANHALALMMAARNDLIGDDAWVREGLWASQGRRPLHHSLSIEKAGIVGLGHIGNAIARRLEPMGMQIAWWGPRPKPSSYQRFDNLTALAEWATLLFVACRGGAETEGLVDRQVIEALGPEGVLINVSRGSVIEEPALIAALGNGTLGRAALDVFTHEPASRELWQDVPNTVLAPHVGGATLESIAKSSAHALANIRQAYRDEAYVNVVT